MVESYRDEEGSPRQRTLVGLGQHPSVESKLAALKVERARLAERLEAAQRDPAGTMLATLTRRSLARRDDEIARLQAIAEELRRTGGAGAA